MVGLLNCSQTIQYEAINSVDEEKYVALLAAILIVTMSDIDSIGFHRLASTNTCIPQAVTALVFTKCR
jgi:hypothetical protein